MRKTLLLSLLVCLASLGLAQPVLDQNGVGTAGDVFYLAVQDTLLPANLVGSSGINQTWDMASLVVMGLDTITFVTPASTGYAASFPSATVGVQQSSLNNGVGFLEVTTGHMDVLGFVADILGTGTPIVAHQTPPLRAAQFPFTYMDMFSNTSTIDVTLDASGFGIPFVDSARYKNIQVRDVMADAYGTLNLPNASYPNVLRTKEINAQTDSTWIHTFLGWQLFSDSVYTDSTFTWADNSKGYTLAEASYVGGVLDNVRFQDFLLVGIAAPFETAFSVFPNPANDRLTVTTDGAGYQIRICDLQGRLVLKQSLGDHQTDLQIGNLQRGCYLYAIEGENGISKKSGKLVVTR
jgi:Secretion system C-terminal sorting domain